MTSQAAAKQFSIDAAAVAVLKQHFIFFLVEKMLSTYFWVALARVLFNNAALA